MSQWQYTDYHRNVVWRQNEDGSQESAFINSLMIIQYLAEGGVILPPDINKTRKDLWEKVKNIREAKSKEGGTPVGSYWFHNDTDSKTQQLSLVIAGANLPTGINWKTMSGAFVPMTPSLALEIFQAATMQEVAIFNHAELLRQQIYTSLEPELIDLEAGWPLTFQDTPGANLL